MRPSRAAALRDLSPAYDPLAEAVSPARGKVLAFAPVGRLCVASAGHCLACGARQGEPCRQPRTAP